MYFEATTNFVLRKTTSKKEKPLFIYASVERNWGEPIYLSTGKKILPSLFSQSGKPITSDFEEGTKPYQEMRALAIHLDTIKKKIDDIVFEINTSKVEFDLETIDEKIKAIIQGTQEQEITILERFVVKAIKRSFITQFLHGVAVVCFNQPLKKGLFTKHNVQEICNYLSEEIGITNAFLKKMSNAKVQKVFEYLSNQYAPTTYNSIVKSTRSTFLELLNIKLNLETSKIKEGDKKTRCILSEEEIQIAFSEWQKIPPARGKINRSKDKADLKFKIEMTKTMHLFVACFLLQCLCCVRFSDISKLVLFVQKSRADIMQQIQESGCYLFEMTTRKFSEQVVIPITLQVVEIVDKISLDRNLAPFMQTQLKQDEFARKIDSYRDKKCTLEDIISSIDKNDCTAFKALQIYLKNKNVEQFLDSLRHGYGNNNNNKVMNQRLQKFFSQLVQEEKIEDEKVLQLKKSEGRTIYISKWSIISSHSGRATWCCNAYKKGLSEAQIIAISGHRDFKTCYKHYLNADSKRDKRRSDVLQAFKMLQM